MSAPLRLVAAQERGERDWLAVVEDNRRWLARYEWAGPPARARIHAELDANTDRLRVLVAEQAARIAAQSAHVAGLRAQLPPRPITESSAQVRHLFAVDGG